MSGLKKEESFTVDGVAIAAPSTYKPVFATTSTKSSKRDQELSMHNSPMGTIGGYRSDLGCFELGGNCSNPERNDQQIRIHFPP